MRVHINVPLPYDKDGKNREEIRLDSDRYHTIQSHDMIRAARLSSALIQLGWQPTGAPNIRRFYDEHGFEAHYIVEQSLWLPAEIGRLTENTVSFE